MKIVPPPPASLSVRAAWAVLCAALALHLWFGSKAVRAQSPTFDEPLHLTAGYAYWKTRDYRLNALHHPPLASLVGAAPLLFLDPVLPTEDPLWLRPRWSDPARQYGFANSFLYRNASGLGADRLMNAGRAAMLAVSAVFLLLFFLALRRFAGPAAAAAGVWLAALSPEFLAHGTVVATDFLFMALYFLFFAAFRFWETETGPAKDRWAAAAGACLGLCFCAKFSAVAAGPVLALWLFARGGRIGLSLRQAVLAALGAAAAVALVYQFSGLSLFLPGLRYTLGRVQTGRAAFLLGDHSTTGWWYYFPLVFLIKTSLPVLLASLAAAVLVLRRRLRLDWFLWLPPAVYFALACTSSVQIGHRHILPVYPFLFAVLGLMVERFWTKPAVRALAAAGGLAVLAAAALDSPYFIASANRLAAPADGLHRRLTDSNVDWGQGLRALGDYLKREGVDKIYLSYFGTGQPEAYGIRFLSIAPYTLPDFPGEDLDLRDQKRALLVVSATNFQGTYHVDKTLFGWLKDRRPDALLAKSLLVFDVTKDAESHRRLAGLFARSGKLDAAARELAWAGSLEKGP